MIRIAFLTLAAVGCSVHPPKAASSTNMSPYDGMILIKGATFAMGSDDPAFFDAQPIHRVRVRDFWIDKTEVTNAAFERFVAVTGYRTVAERLGGGMVFRSPSARPQLDEALAWWSWMPGANWRHPLGPHGDIAGRGDHPVVQITYEDVLAFAAWAGKRLPTEAEWEFAARGGLEQNRYAWGNDEQPDQPRIANTFQGDFPTNDTAEDGYAGTNPVAAFPPNRFGLFGVAGNVWEWVADWYDADYYGALAETGAVSVDPRGPAASFDPAEPAVPKRVQKGGSFLCTPQYCARYMPGGRGRADPDTPAMHTGFRLAKDP